MSGRFLDRITDRYQDQVRVFQPAAVRAFVGSFLPRRRVKNFWVLHSDVFPDLGFDSLGFRGIMDVRLSTPGDSLTNVNCRAVPAIDKRA